MLNQPLQWLFFLALVALVIPGLSACKSPPAAKSLETQLADLEILSVGAPPEDAKLPGKEKPAPFKLSELHKTPSGLQYTDHIVGSGASPKMGDTVKVHYTGWLTDGTLFDSSVRRGEPTSFKLGRVIQGWNEGLQTMKVGGKRVLVIPAKLGYGDKGAGDKIYAGAMLVFEITLLKVDSKK